MKLNWDNIRSIFQIPRQWFQDVQRKLDNAYGTNFIRVKDGTDGGIEIAIDDETFAKAVTDIAGGAVSGKVITVGESDNPINDTVDVVTGVEWKSPNIVIHLKRLTYKNGVVISSTALTDKTIGTTTYSGS